MKRDIPEAVDLSNYALKDDLIPYDLIPSDGWELKHTYIDSGHCDPVTVNGLSMGDYVNLYCL